MSGKLPTPRETTMSTPRIGGTRGRRAACFEGRGYSVIKGNSESFRTDPQQ